MAYSNPNDQKRQGTATPNSSVAQNQGGVPAMPAPPQAPSVPNAPVARNRKDSIVRPVPGANVAGAAPQIPQPLPAAQPGVVQVPPPPAPVGPGGLPMVPPPPMSLQPSVLQPQEQAPQEPQAKPPEQTLAGASGGARPGETPEQTAARNAQATADAQPSPVSGYDTGAYNRSVQTVEQNVGRKLGPKALKDLQKTMHEFGTTPFSNDPDAPAFPFDPARANFNPFSGKFTSGPRPSAFKMLGVE